MDLNICILAISRYNICNLNICILVILRYNISIWIHVLWTYVSLIPYICTHPPYPYKLFPWARQGMGNKWPNWAAIPASQERQSPWPCSHSNSRAPQTFPIYTRCIKIGTYVTHAGLTLRTDTRWWRAYFGRPVTRWGSHVKMRSSILWWSTSLALRECTCWSSQRIGTTDGVGQRNCC
jgi:hypothetical protein